MDANRKYWSDRLGRSVVVNGHFWVVAEIYTGMDACPNCGTACPEVYLDDRGRTLRLRGCARAE